MTRLDKNDVNKTARLSRGNSGEGDAAVQLSGARTH